MLMASRLAWAAVAMLLAVVVPVAAGSARAEPIAEIALWDNATGPHLRGAAITVRRTYDAIDGGALGPGPVGPPFTQQDIDRLAARGANLVVVSHPGLFAETPPFKLDPAMQASLDGLLQMIARADMFAVIAFRTGPGRSAFTFHVGESGDWFGPEMYDDTVWASAKAQQAWAAMWRHAAARYRDVPAVIGYELMVEPNSNEVGADARHPISIWDPQAFHRSHGGTLLDWNQLFPRIVTAIREVDRDTPVLVGGNGYSSLGFLPYVEPLADANLVYIAHTYDPFAYTHQGPEERLTYPGTYDVTWDGEPDSFDAAFLDTLLPPLDQVRAERGRPVAITEFGVARWAPDAARYLADMIARFEARGANYAIWEWSAAYKPYAEISNMFALRFGPNPATAVEIKTSPVLDLLAKVWKRNRLRPSTVTLLRTQP